MQVSTLKAGLLGAALASAAVMTAAPALAQNEQFIPALVYRTGPFAPNGIPIANGFADYITLLNERDGGINGVKLVLEECETSYANDRGVECYERLKRKGPTGAAAMNPYSTGITYALIERAVADKMPIISMGYGRADASDGRVFPWVFTLPTTYWSGANVLIQYIAQQEGGFAKLKGKKIAHVFLDSAYGREPIATFEAMSKQHGFSLTTHAVPSPGLEQKAIWLQIRQMRPDYVTMWGWGVMNATAIKEAAAVGFPRDKFIGVWYSGQEPDVIPAGDAAKGYKALNFHGVGSNYPVHADLKKYVRDKGKGSGDGADFGNVSYNRGMVNAVYTIEGIKTAMAKYGNKPMTGEQVRWGLENLDLSEPKLAALGVKDLMQPVKITCGDHEGGGLVKVQQWDGKQWKMLTDWMIPDRNLLRPMYEASAAKYAQEKNIPPRDCNQVQN